MFGERDFRTITVFVKCFETITEFTGNELLIGSFCDMTLVCWYVWVLLYLWVGSNRRMSRGPTTTIAAMIRLFSNNNLLNNLFNIFFMNKYSS